MNAFQAWLDLQECYYYVGLAEPHKKLSISWAALKILNYKNEETFPIYLYVTKTMIGHIETLEWGQQGKSDTKMVVHLAYHIDNDHPTSYWCSGKRKDCSWLKFWCKIFKNNQSQIALWNTAPTVSFSLFAGVFLIWHATILLSDIVFWFQLCYGPVYRLNL